jgi:hypothetical protein
VRDEFLQDAVILQEDAVSFAGALLMAQLEMFPRFTANVAALDCLLGPLTALNTAAAAEHAAEQQHPELMEEVCQGQTNLADLLMEHLRRLLARASGQLGVVVPCVVLYPQP